METRQHIYLIMKEAINNLVKHSGCHYAEIYVDYKSLLLTIIIKDDDKGVQRVAFPMYVTQQGISQSDGSDLPVQVINVMIRDAGKYDE